MTEPKSNSSRGKVYQIKVKGRLGNQSIDSFEGMTITFEGGITSITGPVTDQAALQGLLIRVRDLGLPLLSVNCIEPDC